MEQNKMKIVITCPSYKRPKVETLDYLPFIRIYVDCDEYDAYVEANPVGTDIVSCPKGIQGNVSRIRNYILEQEFKNGADAVAVVDDDVKGIYHWVNKESKIVKTEEFIDFVYKYSVLATDIGAHFWGININADKQCYREYTPFSTVSFIGGPFQCFVNGGGDCWYDEALSLKEDYDMTLQQVQKHRVVFRVNSYYYDAKQSIQKGGCAVYRNMEREKQQFLALQKKWGKKIIQRDEGTSRSHKTSKVRKHEDYNPIVKIPIKGV